MPATMTTNGRNIRISNRIRVAAQNMLEGDEFLLRGEPSLFVESITRNESKGTVRVRFEWRDPHLRVGSEGLAEGEVGSPRLVPSQHAAPRWLPELLHLLGLSG